MKSQKERQHFKRVKYFQMIKFIQICDKKQTQLDIHGPVAMTTLETANRRGRKRRVLRYFNSPPPPTYFLPSPSFRNLAMPSATREPKTRTNNGTGISNGVKTTTNSCLNVHSRSITHHERSMTSSYNCRSRIS